MISLNTYALNIWDKQTQNKTKKKMTQENVNNLYKILYMISDLPLDCS